MIHKPTPKQRLNHIHCLKFYQYEIKVNKAGKHILFGKKDTGYSSSSGAASIS